MECVVEPRCTDTVLPRPSRRIWTHPALTSHSAVVLTGTRLYLASNDSPPSPDSLSKLKLGGNPEELLGKALLIIPLAEVIRATEDLETNTIALEYGSREARSVSITLTDEESTDELFMGLWRRLASEFELNPDTDRIRSARKPLAVMLGMVLTTFLAAYIVQLAEEFHTAHAVSTTNGTLVLTDSNRVYLKELADRRSLCYVAGGIGLAAAQIWLYRRLTRPATCLIIQRSVSDVPSEEHIVPHLRGATNAT